MTEKIICEECPVRPYCDLVPYDVDCDRNRAAYYSKYKINNKSGITTGTRIYETEIIGYNDGKY